MIEETLTHGVQCTKAPVNKSESSAIRGNEQTSKHIWQVWKLHKQENACSFRDGHQLIPCNKISGIELHQ
jgi:hypothetical protein